MTAWVLLLLVGQAHAGSEATDLDRKGADLYMLGRYEEAARYQRRALLLWSDSPVNLCLAHANLARTYVALGRIGAAEREVRLAEEISSPEDRNWLSLLLAQIHFQSGRYGDAERKLRRILPDLAGLDQATALNDLGMVRAALADFVEARLLMERSLVIRRQCGASGADHGRMLANLALVCFRQGDFVLAASFYREALPIMEGALGPGHAHVGMVLAEYSQVLRKSGRKAESKNVERRARTILAGSLDLPGYRTVDIQSLK